MDNYLKAALLNFSNFNTILYYNITYFQVSSTKVQNNEYNKLQDKKLQTTKNNLNLMVIGCKQ